MRYNISFRKIMALLSMIICVIFIGFTVKSLGGNGNNQMTGFLNYRPVVVISGSMEPAIQVNSISILEYCSIDDLKIGDVVMYRHPDLDINITHRVIGIDTDEVGNKYITAKGDANDIQDELKITSDMVVGKIVKTFNEAVPYMNFIMLSNGQINSIALLQIILFLAVIISIACVILYSLFGVATIVAVLALGDKYTRAFFSKYNANIDKQHEIGKCVEEISLNKKDTLRVKIGKIILAKELKNFEESVKDLDRAYELAKFIGGNKFSNQNYD